MTVLTSRIEPGLPAVEVFEVPAPGSFRVERLATSRLRFVGTLLYLRELARWFARHRVDLAYVSMLKHDAYAVLGAARRWGFPVVLRPEGAGGHRRHRLASLGPVRPDDRPPVPPGRRRRRHLARRPARAGGRRLRRGARSTTCPTASRSRPAPGFRGPGPSAPPTSGRLATREGGRHPRRRLADRPGADPRRPLDPGRRRPRAPSARKRGSRARSARRSCLPGSSPDPIGRAAAVEPVRPPVARGGDEHCPPGSDGAGDADRRLGDPRQPRPDHPGPHGRLAPPDDPAALARRSSPTTATRRPGRWRGPPAAGSRPTIRSPPWPAATSPSSPAWSPGGPLLPRLDIIPEVS